MEGSSTQYSVEILSTVHDRAGFTCGDASLDGYLRKQASQDQKRNLAVVYVLTPEGKTIAGYYTLSSFSISAADLPGEIGSKLPRFPLPATLLGRMAVGLPFRGRHLGRLLLFDALERVWFKSREVASWAVVVDAKRGAREFYLKYGFQPFEPESNRLFLPTGLLAKLSPPSA